MTIMKIIRDQNGDLINIGEWDDCKGANPIPEGSYEDEASVVEGYDGGLYLATDPRKDG
jgi:hypothetical protein